MENMGWRSNQGAPQWIKCEPTKLSKQVRNFFFRQGGCQVSHKQIGGCVFLSRFYKGALLVGHPGRWWFRVHLLQFLQQGVHFGFA